MLLFRLLRGTSPTHHTTLERAVFKIRLNPERGAASSFPILTPDQDRSLITTFNNLKQANAAAQHSHSAVIAVPVATPVVAKPY
eukprot:m.22538 g.22538  ORF g.22538 m.22538 type:complete len:84 (-) comp11263_c0_seq1:96-347(-)